MARVHGCVGVARVPACVHARARVCVCVCVSVCVCARACWRDVSVWCLSVFARRGGALSLPEVLSAYLCWTTSSSGVEQTFSKVERCHLHRGNGQNDAFRRAVVGLTSADPDSKVVHGDEAVISSARALFSAGRSRQTRNNAAGRKQRLDKGTGKFKVKASAAATPRGGTRRGVPQTEAAWLRRRRAELDAVISTPQPKSQSQNQSNAEWTPDMEKEKKRLGKVSEQL